MSTYIDEHSEMQEHQFFLLDEKLRLVRQHGNPLMEVHNTRVVGPVKRRNFFSQCWHAWSPKQRRYRNLKLMPHPKPLANLAWRIHVWVIMSKAEREEWSARPWRVILDCSPALKTLTDFERAWSGYFEEAGL